MTCPLQSTCPRVVLDSPGGECGHYKELVCPELKRGYENTFKMKNSKDYMYVSKYLESFSTPMKEMVEEIEEERKVFMNRFWKKLKKPKEKTMHKIPLDEYMQGERNCNCKKAYKAGHAAGLADGKAELDKTIQLIARAEYDRGHAQGMNDAENKGYYKGQADGVELGRKKEREKAFNDEYWGKMTVKISKPTDLCPTDKTYCCILKSNQCGCTLKRSRFYMVAGPGPSKTRHATKAEAEKEALRLAEKQNCEVYVLGVVGVATCEKSVRYKEL